MLATKVMSLLVRICTTEAKMRSLGRNAFRFARVQISFMGDLSDYILSRRKV